MAARVLVACEYSGVVRDAFTAAGHDAMSCDLLPTEKPGKHYQGDVRDLMDQEWDLVIAHPECTYLSLSGVRWLYEDGFRNKNVARWNDMNDGADFFALMFHFKSPRIAVENPVQHKYAVARHGRGRATQYVQPWMFGHMEVKRTGLWLQNLPLLRETNNVYDEMMKLPYGERAKVHHMAPGPDRWKERSRTKEGLAQAMADQWGRML